MENEDDIERLNHNRGWFTLLNSFFS